MSKSIAAGPPSEGPPAAAPSPSSPGAGLVVAVALLVLVALGGGLALGRWMAPAPPANVTVVRPTPDVVVAVKDLARLQSAEMHVERVVDLKDRQSTLFGLVEAEDAVLLVAAGDVTAGIDLSKLKAGDVIADPQGKSVRMTLPAPEIFSARLDAERTHVHSRRTDMLARRAPQLESKARQEAQRSMEKAARQAGLLERAGRNARRTVASLLRSLGYEKVEVTVASP